MCHKTSRLAFVTVGNHTLLNVTKRPLGRPVKPGVSPKSLIAAIVGSSGRLGTAERISNLPGF